MYPTPPITPSPPAFVTAAASLGPAATFIPASITGWLILRRSVTVVRICSANSCQFAVDLADSACDNLRGEAIVVVVRRSSE